MKASNFSQILKTPSRSQSSSMGLSELSFASDVFDGGGDIFVGLSIVKKLMVNSKALTLISCLSVIKPLLVGKRLWLIEAYHSEGLFIYGELNQSQGGAA
jgi:hypothetical protein